MSSLAYQIDLPVYDNVEYAIGLENFVFKAKTYKRCHEMFKEFLERLPKDKYAEYYKIGLRPDNPIPVSMYFIEVNVIDHKPALSLYNYGEWGKLDI